MALSINSSAVKDISPTMVVLWVMMGDRGGASSESNLGPVAFL
jgi:hypothetical protein